MVQTGRRAAALSELLESGGLRPDTARRRAPRTADLDAPLVATLSQIYRDLGGELEQPTLRPGSWDLSMSGVLIELDEELHFNRYRSAALDGFDSSSLPWAPTYRRLCDEREPECLRAATWGKRWTNPSAARLFGAGGEPGDLAADGGAPRWKQRALYDALKDAVALRHDLHVARLSVWDDVGGVLLGAALEGRAHLDVGALMHLVEERTT